MHRRQLPLTDRRPAPAPARGVVAWIFAALLASAAGGLASSAWAQPQAETEGQRLFREGRDALDRGDVDGACARFEESHRLEGALGPLLNLANCNEKRGRTASALLDWRRAATLARADQVEQRTLAGERIAELERRVPRLTLRRAALAPVDMVVQLDGLVTEVDGAARAVDPGVHRLEIRAAGRTTTTREIRMQDAQVLELTVEPGPAPVASAPTPTGTPPDEREGPRPLLVGGLVASGLGTLGVAVFAVTGVLALGASSDLEAACGADHECPATDTEGRDAAARGDALLVPNAIGLGVGAVGIGVGVTLLVLHATAGGNADAGLAPRLGPPSRSVLVRF